MLNQLSKKISKKTSKKNPFNNAIAEYKKLQEKDDNNHLFEEIFTEKGNEWTHGVGKNQIISAEVVNVDYKIEKIEVRTGLKSNSFISFKEFKINDTQVIPKVGDVISVTMEGIDSNTGIVFVSHKKVKFEERIKEIEKAFNNKTGNSENKEGSKTVEGFILYKQKISINSQYKNNSYVVDLGYGVLAIVISDGHTDHTDLEIGKKFTFYVNKFEPKKKYGITLGIKRDEKELENQSRDLLRHDENHDNIKEGEILTLKVIEHKDFGLLCVKNETTENKDGKQESSNVYFISNKELTLNKRIRRKNEIINLYPIGKVFKAVGIFIENQEKKKLVLSARELFKDLMEKFIENIKSKVASGEDQKINGTIIEKKESEFILKIDFENNIIEGKLHRDDLNWNIGKSINKYRTLNIGDQLEVGINWQDLNMETLDPEYNFLPLSVKILYPDPFLSVINSIKVGNIYPCQFISYNEFGALMSLKINDNTWTDSNVDIFINNKELKELSRDNNTKPGATNHAKVTKIDPELRSINISIRSAQIDNINKYTQRNDEHQYSNLNIDMGIKRKIK